MQYTMLKTIGANIIRVLFVCDGVVKEEAPPEEFFSSPKDPRLVQFLQKVL